MSETVFLLLPPVCGLIGFLGAIAFCKWTLPLD
jgi:hypothetical protein